MTVASIAEFLDMMPDTITIEPWTGADAFGAPTYGAPTTYPAFINEAKEKISRSIQGEEQFANYEVIIGGTPVIRTEDRITLPADFPIASPAIVSANRVSDETGRHHVVVYC